MRLMWAAPSVFLLTGRVPVGATTRCSQGLKNGSVNLFVGIFLVIFTVMQQVFEVLTASFTVSRSSAGNFKVFKSYFYVFVHIVFHVVITSFLVYASVRQMLTVANDIWWANSRLNLACVRTSLMMYLCTLWR